jgi:hypothetical protein
MKCKNRHFLFLLSNPFIIPDVTTLQSSVFTNDEHIRSKRKALLFGSIESISFATFCKLVGVTAVSAVTG